MKTPQQRILFHFTNQQRLERIYSRGINMGRVPISTFDEFNAPWFTSDADLKRQFWAEEPAVKKTEVRLSVQFPYTDAKLIPWTRIVARERVNASQVAEIYRLARGRVDDWYVYEGVVPVFWIIKYESFAGTSGEPECILDLTDMNIVSLAIGWESYRPMLAPGDADFHTK